MSETQVESTQDAKGKTQSSDETITLPAAALKDRLERAEHAAVSRLFKELGVSDANAVKAALDAARAAEESKKSEAQRATELAAQAATAAAELSRYRDTVRARSDRELSALTEAQRLTVTKLAGEDPARVLDTIDTLKPTWAVGEQSTRAPAPIAPPISTVAVTTKPVGTDSKRLYPELETYEALVASGRGMAAASFHDKHGARIHNQIDARRKAQSK